jgi:arsenite-transporting ATPase
MTAVAFLEPATRVLFFTGKGGVGKTSVACASALRLAGTGKRVLLVSTDPASNLDEVLGTPLSSQPRAIHAVPGLFALNIDPGQAAEAYRERVLAPIRQTGTEEEVATLREQLSGACTTEIAAFDAFAGLLGGSDAAASFDHLLFDTAPTGHTLRLLSLPGAWTDFLDHNARGASCLGPHSALTTRRDRFAAAFEALTDPDLTTLVLVARPEQTSLREAARTALELRAQGLSHQTLVINGVFRASAPDDETARNLEARCTAAVDGMPLELQPLPRLLVPLHGFNTVGLPALQRFFEPESTLSVEPGDAAPTHQPPSLPATPILHPLSELVDRLAAESHGLVMVMGKGGVGKTSIAAALAMALAERGLPVHLSTTDPAAHVAAAVGKARPNLELSRIDPEAETRAYTERVLATRGRGLSAEERAMMEEDLRSPCTEEVAVFHAFSRLVAQARRSLIILDTAPTGHTLLLLDATGAYHRQVLQDFSGDAAGRLTTPLMRLRDPAYTRVLIVTLAETTPISEAAALQAELRRAGIEPYAWVVNSSIAATGSRDPLLKQRGHLEHLQLARLEGGLAERVYTVPWTAGGPSSSPGKDAAGG